MSLHEYLETVCKSIFDTDKNVLSVAIINKRGRVVDKISRQNFAKQFPDYLNELFCMHLVLQVSMGRDFDEKYGPINYNISERSDLTTLAFPIYENVLLVASDKSTTPIDLARKITGIISDYRNPS